MAEEVEVYDYEVLPDFSSIVNTDRDYQISHAVKP
jgi:hypothetical protein